MAKHQIRLPELGDVNKNILGFGLAQSHWAGCEVAWFNITPATASRSVLLTRTQLIALRDQLNLAIDDITDDSHFVTSDHVILGDV